MNNKCTNKQSGGYDFSDFNDGPVGIFDGFLWNGFTCKNNGGRSNKRYEPRTIGGFGKVLGGTCHPEKEKSPSFGCGFAGSDIDRFSLGHIHVQPEFDCDLEFHYDMPDGSKCKHRTACSKSGTTVKNSQCGGAKNVTIVYPTQPSKPKPTCSIDIHTISFSCGPPTQTKTRPPKTRTSTTEAPGTTYEASTTTTSASQPGETYSASQPPVDTYTATQPGETTSASQPVQTYSQPGETSSASQPGETYSAGQPPVDTYTASQPGETTSQPGEVPTYSASQPGEVPTYTASQPEQSSSALPVTDIPSSTYAVETTTTVPSGPTETLPCPNVVPACLNTFIFGIGCLDNSDTACYCPDTIFVQNIFDCIYAHGETAEIVTEAIIFVQGLCAQYVPSNPAIATGATVTSYVTVTAQPTVSVPVYTTVSVVTTTVVPCTDDNGATISNSYSTVVISTAITVPQVGFTTGTDSSVGVVPVTSYPAIATNTNISPITTLSPVGTGSFVPVPTNPGFVTVSGAGRVSASFGFAIGVMALIAIL